MQPLIALVDANNFKPALMLNVVIQKRCKTFVKHE
jgi:hypothetical protein